MADFAARMEERIRRLEAENMLASAAAAAALGSGCSNCAGCTCRRSHEAGPAVTDSTSVDGQIAGGKRLRESDSAQSRLSQVPRLVTTTDISQPLHTGVPASPPLPLCTDARGCDALGCGATFGVSSLGGQFPGGSAPGEGAHFGGVSVPPPVNGGQCGRLAGDSAQTGAPFNSSQVHPPVEGAAEVGGAAAAYDAGRLYGRSPGASDNAWSQPGLNADLMDLGACTADQLLDDGESMWGFGLDTE
mmetsp:Transcript_9446/g.21591  ORF Transcript_9446/g.21591 Transcript_9446/m.21591 type:complete len:246 (+) Transcript_9446:134-871(+)